MREAAMREAAMREKEAAMREKAYTVIHLWCQGQPRPGHGTLTVASLRSARRSLHHDRRSRPLQK